MARKNIFFITMLLSTIFFIKVLGYIQNFEIIQTNKAYDIVIARQKSGYFEFTLNSEFIDIEYSANKELFNK